MIEKTYTMKQILTQNEIDDITESAIGRLEVHRSWHPQYIIPYNSENKKLADKLFEDNLLGYALLKDIEKKHRFIQVYALKETDATKLITNAVVSDFGLRETINPLPNRDKWGRKIKPVMLANILGTNIYGVDDYSMLYILRLLKTNRKAWSLNGKVYKVFGEYNITNPYRVSDYLPKGN